MFTLLPLLRSNQPSFKHLLACVSLLLRSHRRRWSCSAARISDVDAWVRRCFCLYFDVLPASFSQSARLPVCHSASWAIRKIRIWSLSDLTGLALQDILVSELVKSRVLAIEDLVKHRVTNVVFMAMGEPILNMKSVLEAHQCLNKYASYTRLGVH
ncbi:hypothetical protein Cgig2_008877 [Carnegiea gigantea]|uniref:Radical SAM core domain-containing protein n=1 Tax=Carnegiea gigantea TaxID=171969 RepID=A0A9Q1JJ82_9CARY|nr:hypothetical protein Cgig2_008877 [Carnegiea gigantea]